MMFLETSALSGANIEEAFNQLAKLIMNNKSNEGAQDKIIPPIAI
jgi:hypothetical protein